MSSLIFVSDQNQVLAATDTLATSPDGKPVFFTTKALALPHLQMIMCGTGMSGFLGKWFVEVNDRMLARDIDNLDYHAPLVLSSLWDRFREEYSIPNNLTTTVYHLGFSEHEDVIHNYVYRSERDFVSESLPYGIVVKPECNVPENPIFPNCIKEMMREQRAIQESHPASKRVYIGGKIQVHHLTKSEITIYTLDQFEDFKSVQQQIYTNYDSDKNKDS